MAPRFFMLLHRASIARVFLPGPLLLAPTGWMHAIFKKVEDVLTGASHRPNPDCRFVQCGMSALWTKPATRDIPPLEQH